MSVRLYSADRGSDQYIMEYGFHYITSRTVVNGGKKVKQKNPKCLSIPFNFALKMNDRTN